MMAYGIGEIILVLLLGGFLPRDVEPLPAEQVLAHLPAQCEFMVFMDLRGVDASLTSMVQEITSQTWLMSSPELAEGVTEAMDMIDMVRSQAPAMLGFDPFTQLSSVSACMRLGISPEGIPLPEFLVVVQGSFDPSAAGILAGLVGMTPRATLPSGHTVYGTMEEAASFSLASVTPGLLFFGSKDLVDPRLAMAGAPLVEPMIPGSLHSRVADLLGGGSYSFIGFQPSPGLRSLMSGEMPLSLAQLFNGMQRAIAMTTREGLTLELTALDSLVQRRYELLMEGIKEYALAFNHIVRALLWGGAGFLSPDDYELDPPLRQLLAHREEILSYVNENLLTGEPEVLVFSDSATRTTSLTLNHNAMLQAGTGAIALGAMMAYFVTLRGAPYDYGAEPYEEYGGFNTVCPDGTVCPPGQYCDPCATSSCPTCADCVPGCVLIPAEPE